MRSASNHSRRRVARVLTGRAALLATAALLAFPSAPLAHEIPASVTIRAFVKPEGKILRLVVRVPLEAMRDVKIPLRGPGYLMLGGIDAALREAATTWITEAVQIHEGDTQLGSERLVSVRVSLPSDRSFAEYTSAVAHVLGPPLPDTTEIAFQQAMFDVLVEYPITSDSARFSINPALARLGVRTTTILRFLPAHSPERAFQYSGDPGLVRLDPRWTQAALSFVRLGFFHILDGLDHLLFVFCLVIPFRRIRPLVAIVTSFTVAHSITLIASVAGFAPSALWFPPLIEVLIAGSIVYMAFENIVGPKLDRRWLIAFAFGLVHGFGFSFALRDSLQFAGTHLATSLLSFNVGVEFGQVLVLLLTIPVLDFLFKRVVAERVGTILLSALVAHTAWHWMTARADALRQYQFEWPAFDLALAVGAMRGLMLLLILGGALWLMFGLYRWLNGQTAGPRINADKTDDLRAK